MLPAIRHSRIEQKIKSEAYSSSAHADTHSTMSVIDRCKLGRSYLLLLHKTTTYFYFINFVENVSWYLEIFSQLENQEPVEEP